MAVRADRADPLQVRQHLRGATGVLQLPPSWETPSRELPSDTSMPLTTTTREASVTGSQQGPSPAVGETHQHFRPRPDPPPG
jgi:nitrogen fixation protein